MTAAPTAVAGSYAFPHEAEIARASLEAAGIPAIVADQHTVNENWMYSQALGGVRVLVEPQFLEEAQKLLAKDFSDAVEIATATEPESCPVCGSENIEIFTRGKRHAFLVFLLLGFPLYFYKHGMKCDDCDHF